MDILDAQLHAWVPESQDLPWHAASLQAIVPATARRYASTSVSAEQLVWMMDAVGVDAAVLTSPLIYGDDHRYVFESAERYPGRFGVVGPLFPATSDVVQRVQTFLEQPWAVGIRVVAGPTLEHIDSDGYRRIFAAAEKADVPVFVVAKGMLQSLRSVAHDYPNLLLVIDHLGVTTDDPSVDKLTLLPDLLALAVFDNVTVKCTSAPDLSSERYPFLDLWPHLHRVVEAFGVDRVMWGTDITQHFGKLTYCEAVDYMRRTDQLSESEKELILGKNARRILPWPAQLHGVNGSGLS